MGEYLGRSEFISVRISFVIILAPRACGQLGDQGAEKADMQVDGELKQRLESWLCIPGSRNPEDSRFVQDARRFCARISAMVRRKVVPQDTDVTSLELACLALQLPVRNHSGFLARGARSSLRDRAEQAAEMLVGLTNSGGRGGPEPDVEETIQLLQQVYQRTPETDLAKLLADALNLEDFGVSGLVALAVASGRNEGTVGQVAEGCVKREEYGYWEARLKDGFHFEPVRQLARKRLEQARKMAALLVAELKEDGAL